MKTRPMFTVVTVIPIGAEIEFSADRFDDFPTALHEAMVDADRGANVTIYGEGMGPILALSPPPNRFANN